MDLKTFPPFIVLSVLTMCLLCIDTAAPLGGSTPIIRYPGDVDVLAVLHFQQTVTNDFQCSGTFNYRAAYDVEVLRYALHMVNSNLQDCTIGLTVVDTCGSPAVTVRDVVRVLSGSVEDLPATGPTIGILVPGVGEVTRAIFEQVTRVLDIPTIGYLPTEERFLLRSDVEAGARTGDADSSNEARGDNPDPVAETVSPTFSSKSTSANSDETTSPLTNVTNDMLQPNSNTTKSTSLLDKLTTAIELETVTVVANNSDVSGTEMSSTDETMTGDIATRYDTTTQSISTSNAVEEGSVDGQQMNSTDAEDEIFLLTSAVPLTSEASVITAVLSSASWFEVGVFYSGYGAAPSKRTAFIKLAEEEGICVSFEESIPRGFTQEMSDRIIRDLSNSSDPVEVLVWIVTPRELEILLRSIRLVSVKFRGVGVFSDVNDNLNAFLQDEDENSVFIDNLQYDNTTGYIEFLDGRLNESDINNWLNFTLNKDNSLMIPLQASHTESLVRAIGMLARCFTNYTFQQTDDSKGVLNLPTTAVCRAILEGEYGNIQKMYGIYLVQNSSAMQIANVSGDAPVLSLEGFELPVAYRADGCICLASGLTLAEPLESPWTHNFSDPWIPVIFCVSLVFGLFAFVLFFVFIATSQRPAMKKTPLLANLLLLVGIMLMYFINLFYARVPTNLSCGFRQFGTAFIYAWVFSALLVKAMAALKNLHPKNDYDTTQEPRRNKLSNFGQLSAFSSFLAPQIALSVQWIVFTSPAAVPDPEVCGVFECNVSNVDISLSMIYVFILALVTSLVSLRRLTEFSLMHESQSLFLSSVCTIFLLAGWIVVFTVADPVYNIPAICIGVTANATVILLASFGPACCVITYGQGTRPKEEEDANDDIAYVNPVFLNSAHESTAL